MSNSVTDIRVLSSDHRALLIDAIIHYHSAAEGCDESERDAALEALNKPAEFSDLVLLCGESSSESHEVARARVIAQDIDEAEVDETAYVSRCDDGSSFVMAWVHVPAETTSELLEHLLAAAKTQLDMLRASGPFSDNYANFPGGTLSELDTYIEWLDSTLEDLSDHIDRAYVDDPDGPRFKIRRASGNAFLQFYPSDALRSLVELATPLMTADKSLPLVQITEAIAKAGARLDSTDHEAVEAALNGLPESVQ